MNKQEIGEQLKYSSSEWIYIVTCNNVLKQLFCPFKVIVLSSVGVLVQGEIVLVKAVKVTMELKTVFVIEGKAYYYFHFDFVLD
jgi:hypothetical protein